MSNNKNNDSNRDWAPWNETKKWKTKSNFFQWLRGQIRKSIWQSYVPKNEFKASKLIAVTPEIRAKHNLSNQVKKVGQCVYCNNWFAASKLQVDHIEQAGKLTSEEDILPFIKSIACMKSNLCLACEPCHKIKSYSERFDISFEDAAIEKALIRYMADTSTERQKQVLRDHNKPMATEKVRRDSLRQLIKAGVDLE